MKLIALTGCCAVLVFAIAGQQPSPTLPEPLAGDIAKLAAGKGLKVHFTKRIIGEAPKAYTLQLGKDKKFKLSYDDGFVLSDGTSIYVYKKADNTYTQSDLSAKKLQRFGQRLEVLGWEAFLQEKPGSDIASAATAPNRKVQGHDVQVVEVTYKPDGKAATLFIDPATGLTTGWRIKLKDTEYLILADKVETEAAPETEFAFVAPDGAKLTQEEATFASVQEILTSSCMPCHSSDHKRAGVDLSSYDGIAASVTAGKSATSLLIKAVKGDGVEFMPKGRGPLTDAQISELASWIDAGAKNE